MRYLNGTQTKTKSTKDIQEQEKVIQIFDHAASSYDNLIDVMWLGIHRSWRKKLIDRLAPVENTKLIDVAGGTGAGTFYFLDYIRRNNVAKNCHVTLCDINESMMEIAKRKAVKYDPKLISFVKGDAEDLPFENASFNAYTMCFGMKYCQNVDKVFNEAYRVLQPGGKILHLELNQVENKVVKWLFNQYGKYMVPMFGRLYRQTPLMIYLMESIQRFPDQESLKTMMEEAGFQQVTYENLHSGMATIHMGIKPY
ncbi:2-methoxy-6-polyprenyl-1,4-benzoquinol methylase, mitochondrial-like isoform X3 [Tenebrio molitor]|uniref:2-methoxy-6-polyprenyl-1,4-benzoquinol methylase, mitochondrial-like isoform X3 n=1 Tax=Tenebrio molitor TaxID=7067 RepID=UPI0036247963